VDKNSDNVVGEMEKLHSPSAFSQTIWTSKSSISLNINIFIKECSPYID